MAIDRLGKRCRYLLVGTVLALAASSAAGHGDPSGFAVSASEASAEAVKLVKLPPGARTDDGMFPVESARAANLRPVLQAYGQIVPNPSAVLDVNTGVSGQVAQVLVRPGDRVRKGEPMITVFNPEFITTQKGYLEFLKNEEKLQVLREEGRLPNYLKDAKENLRWWGMDDGQIGALIEHGKVVEHIVLRAPSDGFVTDVLVKPGALVNAGDRTMKQFVIVGKAVARMVAAGASLWAEGYVYANQLALVRPGQAARVTLADGRSLDRAVATVSPVVEPQSQRARFLVDLGRRVAGAGVGQAVTVDLRLDPVWGTWIPRQAVLGQGFEPVAYVRVPNGYERRPLTILEESDRLLCVHGVEAGEQVVVAGLMMLEGLFRMSAGAAADSHHDDHH